MVVLAVGSAFAGYFWNAFSREANWFETWLSPVVGFAQKLAHIGHVESAEPSVLVFAVLGTAAALIGAFIGYRLFAHRRIPSVKKNETAAPVGGKAAWTFALDYVHAWFVAAFEGLAWVCDRVVDKLVLVIQWTIGSLVVILGDGVRALQVRKIRLQVALGIAGMSVIAIVAYLCGGLF